jgi:lipid II:glycine glycyltransferase (peptidoglycan interpeptide bridge formation enzyme)
VGYIKDMDQACVVAEQPSKGRTQIESSLFHEPWWLCATTDGRYEESRVKQGSDVVGRLPYAMVRRGPFCTIRMPRFTHLLGPVVNAGLGKPQTRLIRRLSIIRSLIDQLPPHSFFLQHLDPSIDGGLAIADGLAFQDRGFSVAPQYTFEIDCRKSSEDLWTAMHFKTRQHIRRAEENYVVRSVDDPQYFIRFYLSNIEISGKVNQMEFECFPALFSECRARKCGEILSALAPDGSPVAMVYLVWGHNTMYYLLSTRAPDKSNNGAVNFLIWSGMKQASQLGLVFDLDGVYSSGTARFLSGFGGQIKTRLTVRRSRMPYRALQFLKSRYKRDESQFFT